MIQCVLTKFTAFYHVTLPFNLDEISSKLAELCGFVGIFQTVSYFQDGICFNKLRYFSQSDSSNVMFDDVSGFGIGWESVGKPSYLLKVHNEIFQNSSNHFYDSKDCTVLLNVDPSEEETLGFNNKAESFVAILLRNFESLQPQHSSSCSSPFKLYPSTMLEVNMEDKILYGYERDFEELRSKANICGRTPYERMMNQPFVVQQRISNAIQCTSNHIVNPSGIINDGFKDYRPECPVPDDEDRIISDLLNQSSVEDFGMPPSRTPEGFSRVRELFMTSENIEQLKSPDHKMKDWTDLFKRSFPVGLNNPTGSHCFENVCFRVLYENHAFIKQVEVFIKLAQTKHCVEELVRKAYLTCAFLYCGYGLSQVSEDPYKTSEQRTFDLRVLRNALITKAKKVNSDVIEAGGNCCAIETMDFILDEMFKEIRWVDRSHRWTNYERVELLFKNKATNQHNCKTHNFAWEKTLNEDQMPWVSRFDGTTLLEEGAMERFEDQCFYAKAENQEEIIHLTDLCSLCNKNWGFSSSLRCEGTSNVHCRKREEACSTTTSTEVSHCSKTILLSITRASGMKRDQGGDVVGTKKTFGVTIPYLYLVRYATYELKAAILHIGGGTGGGHYVVCKQDKEGSCLFISDNVTTVMTEEEYVKKINFNAVLLVYERVYNNQIIEALRTSPEASTKPLRPSHLNTVNNSDDSKVYQEHCYERDHSHFGPELEKFLLDNDEVDKREAEEKRKASLRSRKRLSLRSSHQQTLTQYVSGTNKRSASSLDPVSLPNEKKSKCDIIEVNDFDMDSLTPPDDDDQSFGSYFSEEGNETENILSFDIEPEFIKGSTKLTRLINANGLHQYEYRDDVEYPCLFCNASTMQKVGKMGYICNGCFDSITDMNNDPINLRTRYEELQQLQKPLRRHCIKCYSALPEGKNYHQIGNFVICYKCYSNGACFCATCINGVDNIKDIKLLCNEIVKEAFDRSNKYEINLKKAVVARDRMVSENLTTDDKFKKVQNSIYFNSWKGRIVRRANTGYSKKEQKLFEMLKETKAPILNQFRGIVLRTCDIVKLVDSHKEEPNEMFEDDEDADIPSELVRYYVNMLSTFIEPNKNPYLTRTNKHNVEDWMKDLITNKALQRRERHVLFIFGPSEDEDDSAAVYFADFDNARNVKLTYFDPKYVNEEERGIHDAYLQCFWNDNTSDGKEGKGIAVVSDFDDIFGKANKAKRSFNRANNSVYAMMFLQNSLLHCNESDTKIVVMDKYLKAMKTQIAMAVLLEYPNWF